MKYEKKITEAFTRLGFAPRENQVEYVNLILTAFIDEEFKDVVLNAPTGTGKSIIGAVTAECIRELKPVAKDLGSIILMHNNALVKQYAGTFKNNDDFMMIKGAGQYPCAVLNTVGAADEKFSGEDCIFQMLMSAGDDTLSSACRNCEFKRTRNRKNSVNHLITNYSYYFVDTMYSNTLEKRAITVWDEAHTINDMFTEHNTVFISVKRINKILEEITEHLKLGKSQIYQTLTRIRADLKDGILNEKTYSAYLQPLYATYKEISESCNVQMSRHLKNVNQYTKFARLQKKYFNFGCKIDDLLNYNYEHVVQLMKDEQEFTIKPIFVGDMFNTVLRSSEYNLFMSATITDKYMVKTLKLDPKTTKMIQLPPSFPPENKKIIFFDPLSLNYTSMKEESTLRTLEQNVKRIVEHHVKKGDSGIILAPSFVITERLAKIVKTIPSVRVFEHVRGQKLDEVLGVFKSSNQVSIILSPSMFEGIDLPDDISRYQILVKAPYPSLGDNRIKYILDKYPDIYELLTIKKVIQGSGRSVRSQDDYAVTYMLDSNLQRIWRSPQNIWKNEFSVNYTKILM